MTSPASGASGADLPDYAPVPRSSLGPALNDQGYYVGRVERNLYYVTDGVYQSAFLTTRDGVVLFDAPPGRPARPMRCSDDQDSGPGTNSAGTRPIQRLSTSSATGVPASDGRLMDHCWPEEAHS